MARLRDGTEEIELPENGSDEIHAIIKNCWEIDHKTRPSFQQLAPQLEALLDDEHKKYYHLIANKFGQLIESNRIFRRDPPARDSKSTASSGDNRPKTSSINQKKTEPTSPTIAPASKSYITIIPEDKPASSENDGYLEPHFHSQKPKPSPAKPDQSGYLEPISKFKMGTADTNIAPAATNNGDYLLKSSSKKVSWYQNSKKDFLV